MIGPCGTPLVFVFNLDLTEGPKPKFLQSARTNAKQKKCRDQYQNMMKVQRTMTYLRLYFNDLMY